MINPFLKNLYPPTAQKKFKEKGIHSFSDFDIDFASKTLRTKPYSFWQKEGDKMVLNLFEQMTKRVPAYRDFLKKNKIKPSQIKTIDDFKLLPVMDKQNYMKKYPLKDLCWDGKIENNSLFSVSSGSSGAPFFWPRGDSLELETSITHGLMLSETFGADKKSTLFVNSFSMGVYIAGVVILNSALRVSEKGYPLTIVTPGLDIKDAIRTIKELGPSYDQVILAGYPPFLKDIIDRGTKEGVKWGTMNMKFLFAAENFSETFRDYLLRKTKSKDAIHSSASIYGSADASIMSNETPLTVFMRKAATKDKNLYRDLFEENSYMPTLSQYNPMLKYFENINNELIFSAYGGIPLLRYNIHDSGRIISYEEALSMPSIKNNKELQKEIKSGSKLPFLEIFGKSDLTISFYGLKIYPENIKAGLENKSIKDFVSGKFVIQQKNQSNQDQYWEIDLELNKDIRETHEIREKVTKSIMKSLKEKNAEYNALLNAMGKKAHPTIKFFAKGDKKHFNDKSLKQRWKKT